MVQLVNLEAIESTSETPGVDAITRCYITEFLCHEVDIDYEIEDIGGI